MIQTALNALAIAGLLLLGAYGGSLAAPSSSLAQAASDDQYPACAGLTGTQKQDCIEREKAKQNN